MPYDIIAIGNHELYSYASAKEIYDHCERWWVKKYKVGLLAPL